MTLAEMLEANSIPEPNSGCLLWLRACSNGYPTAWWEGRQQYVTRLALKAKGVDLADDEKACHRCDVTICVNEDHLFAGTNADNMHDASAKGRLARVRRIVCSEGHPLSGDNLYVVPKSGQLVCRICDRRRGRIVDARRRARKRAHG